MQQKDIFDYITPIIAVVGLLLSILNLVRDVRRNSRRISIVVDMPFVQILPDGNRNAIQNGLVTITNASPRPITITNVYAMCTSRPRARDKHVLWHMVVMPNYDGGVCLLPITLNDGAVKSFKIASEMADPVGNSVFWFHVIITDSEGNKYFNYSRGSWWEFFPKARVVSYTWPIDIVAKMMMGSRTISRIVEWRTKQP